MRVRKMGSFLHHLSKHLLLILLLSSWETECASGPEPNHLRFGSGHSGDISPNYFFYLQSEYPRDCQEVLRGCSSLNRSGVYVIKPDGYSDPVEVYCDHAEGSGGWTVIQRRVEGSMNFERSWEEYKKGFGFLSNDFWLGNEILSYITNQGVYELRMDMELSNGSSFYVTYDYFRISDEWDAYEILRVGNSTSSGTIVVNTEPTFQTSCPATLGIRAVHGAETGVANFSPPVCNDTGDIGVITSVCSSADGLTSGSAFPVGTTTVTCTCTNSGSMSASCSFLVEISEWACDSGWLAFGGSCYRFYNDRVNWAEAVSVCSSVGGHLVWVESGAENRFLRNNIGYYTWIGIEETARSVWKYEGTGVSTTYFNWDSGQPNAAYNEHCVVMYTSGVWHDYGCTYTLEFICEKA